MYQIPENVQMALEDFKLPFGGKLDGENRWVQMAGYVPWEMVEEVYAAKFKNERPDGKKPISSRIAFGSLFIREHEKLVDTGTVQHISENPHMQFFLGLRRFQTEPLFDASMLTHFRKRFSAEEVNASMKNCIVGYRMPKMMKTAMIPAAGVKMREKTPGCLCWTRR
jgi:hypothetical protein